MTFYVRIVRQQSGPLLRYALPLPAEIFDSAAIDNPEFAARAGANWVTASK